VALTTVAEIRRRRKARRFIGSLCHPS